VAVFFSLSPDVMFMAELSGEKLTYILTTRMTAEIHKKNSHLTVKHRGGFIMLWACAPARPYFR